MKFAGVLLAVAAAATALPNVGPSGKTAHKPHQEPFWPVQQDVTVEQAKAICGEGNQVACCNEVSYAGDTTEIATGPLAGTLKDLLGGKNGAKGLGLFDKCSRLNVDLLLGLSSLINQECKQHIACCQGNEADSSNDLIGLNIPCIALGSLL
ncbi:hypothetical protein VTN31DRAFT_4959 [Thermomyces dupontii]|uniref:uncharacterized protein n=1 Tax=Talaromyces thermophilus TaxID=28565 RepID=UPI0000F066C9